MNEKHNPGQRQFGEDLEEELTQRAVRDLKERMQHKIAPPPSPRAPIPGTAPTAPEVKESYNVLSWVFSLLGSSCNPTKEEQERSCRVCGI